MQEKTSRKIELLCIIALLVVALPSADFLFKQAFALSVTNYAVGGTVPNDAIRVGSKVYVAETGSDQVRILTADTATSLATISLTGAVRLYEHGGRIYATGTSNVIEIDAILNVQLRSMAHGCSNGYGFSQDPTNSALLACYAVVANTVRQVNLDSMTVTFTSTTTNTGSFSCDIGTNDSLFVDFTNNVAFIACDADNAVVVIEGLSTSGTPDFEFTYAISGRSTIGYSGSTIKTLVVGGAATMKMLQYTTATSLVQLVDYPTITSNGNAFYNLQSNRFAVLDGVNDDLILLDGTNGNTIASIGMTVNTGVGSGNQKGNWFSSTVIYMGANAVQSYIKVDTSGLPAGTGGSVSETPTGNNQINGVCGNTDVNGDGRVNVLDCAGSVSPFSGITGGRSTTEITALVTNGIGLTDCVEDGSDVETCGSGLFTFILLLLITEFLVLAGYLGLTRLTNSSSDIMDIALLLVIMAFADLAIAFYLDWIPDLVFYTIIVITAGFLAFGLLKKFGRG